MRRVGVSAVLLVILAVAVPSGAASTEPVGCSGVIAAGGTASCVLTFQIPHFNPDDAIDYDSLVAHIVSPHAISWRVSAKIADAKGKVYFAWECAASRSTVTGDSSAYFDRSCEAWRKLAKTKQGQSPTYYTADTSNAQILTVTAWVGSCVPSGTAGCRFEAAANYVLSG